MHLSRKENQNTKVIKMSFEYIKYEVNDGVAQITINRPEVYGALNRDSKLEIIKAVKNAGKDDLVRVIVLTSEGKAFCSGQDLNDRTVDGSSGPVDLGHTLETEWNPLVDSIRKSEKIVIGAVNGVCAGAGLSVALSCDLIISKPEAKFVSGFSQLGLAPDAGSSYTFVKALGRQKTLEFFLFNMPMKATELEKYGLINKLSDNPVEDAIEMAKTISNMAPLSLAMIKKNLQAASEESFEEVIKKETVTQRFLGNSSDYQEGLKAFFDKRKPEFQGN